MVRIIYISIISLLASTATDAQSPEFPPLVGQTPALEVIEPSNSLRAGAVLTSTSGCLYEGAEYTIGAAKCISDQLWLICQAPDANHSVAWWEKGQQALCRGRPVTSHAAETTDKQSSPPTFARVGAKRVGPCCPLQSPTDTAQPKP
jgi:hypothetical protein